MDDTEYKLVPSAKAWFREKPGSPTLIKAIRYPILALLYPFALLIGIVSIPVLWLMDKYVLPRE